MIVDFDCRGGKLVIELDGDPAIATTGHATNPQIVRIDVRICEEEEIAEISRRLGNLMTSLKSNAPVNILTPPHPIRVTMRMNLTPSER